ncbi:MAG TPA: ABC transporter substrate binding protein, partial [Zoogloea sp.]|nr:ABC transporter substrate binding protein [Zoogloea sp.]
DISFWVDRVHHGVLASMAISELEQGRAAGRLARAILVEGTPPSALPIRSAVKGHPVINLARAKQLGLGVKSSLLLSSEVITHFPWEHDG